MKYLIVSIYDSGWEFGVCDNGTHIPRRDKDDHPNQVYRMFNNLASFEFREWLKKEYEDYDLIVLCEDGDIFVLKDERQ